MLFYATPYLQVEELQAVKLVEDVVWQGSEPAAVHVEALELLEAAESSPLQSAKVGVVSQVQLLQVPQLAEGPCLDPRDVVGKQPKDLVRENTPAQLREELPSGQFEISAKTGTRFRLT